MNEAERILLLEELDVYGVVRRFYPDLPNVIEVGERLPTEMPPTLTAVPRNRHERRKADALTRRQ